MTKEEIAARIKNTNRFFSSHKTLPYDFRIEQLKRLQQALLDYEKPLIDALYKDLHKTGAESYMTEIGMVHEEIRFLSKNLKKLMKPHRVRTPLSHFLSLSKQYYEPFGTVLIMSPWNYPVNLTLMPLAGAIAAGNCAILKPSNYSYYTSQVLADVISHTFEPHFVSVITGGRAENTEVLEQKFDYIFFTGGTKVGKLVMESAARHLTPVTLELGGKSPCIVDETADINLAAKRIVFGKLLNGGQTCVAPDYVLIHESVKLKFIEACKNVLHQFLPTEAYTAKSMPHIITDVHFERLKSLIDGEHVVIGGELEVSSRFFPFTVLDDVTFDSPVMQEEIFGPVLPLITFSHLEWAEEQICLRPKPLALYLFTKNSAVKKKILSELSFGGGCVNDTVVHIASSFLPFGGVGQSGMGSYHGKNSFFTFSHAKSVMEKSLLFDVPIRYHPYSEKKLKILKKLL